MYIELQLDRYKYVVQVVIGEQRGEGVRYIITNKVTSLLQGQINLHRDDLVY